jgi:hypothetical protein
MRKAKLSVMKAIDRYRADVSERFPGLSFETTLQPELGVEAWLWIGIDPRFANLQSAIREYTSQLTLRVLDEEDLNIVAIPQLKEPVHG